MVNLLLDCGCSIDLPGEDGYTALHLAAEAGLEKIIKLLLERGANVNAQTLSKDTPLTLSLVRMRMDVTRLLLSMNADPNIRNSTGGAALHVLKCVGPCPCPGESICGLLESGADPTLIDNWGDRAIAEYDYD